MLFGKKRKEKTLSYDRENQIPIIKSSICNGEQVAGLKDIRTGKFQEIMLISDKEDLQEFCKLCDVEEVKKEY